MSIKAIIETLLIQNIIVFSTYLLFLLCYLSRYLLLIIKFIIMFIIKDITKKNLLK